MNLEKIYYHFCIHDNEFNLVTTSTKPLASHSALSTLKKIEFIVANNLKNSSASQDLKEISSKIQARYKEKTSKLSWISRKLFTQEKTIDKICKSINKKQEESSLISNPVSTLFNLPDLVIIKIVKYLDLQALGALNCVNRQSIEVTFSGFNHFAKNFGYSGTQAVNGYAYLQELFKAIYHHSNYRVKLFKKAYVKKKSASILSNDSNAYISYFTTQTLKNLKKSLTVNGFFKIFLLMARNTKMQNYHTSQDREKIKQQVADYKKIINIFNPKEIWNLKPSKKRVGYKNEAFLYAVSMQNKNVLQLMLMHGADINSFDNQGNHSLSLIMQQLSCSKENQTESTFEFIKFLIEKKVNVNNINSNQMTPLIYSVFCSLETTELLLKNGASETLNYVSHYSLVLTSKKVIHGSVLHYAAQLGQLDQIQLFIKYGANLEIEDKEGCTPLTRAVMSKKTEAAKLLIEKGANIEAQDKKGHTPLIEAVIQEDKELTDLLIKRGANVNGKDFTSKTPLILAVINGNVELTELLIKRGANVNSKDSTSKTPLISAVINGNVELTKLLIENQANVEETYEGCSLLVLAIIKKNEEVVAFLQERGITTIKLNHKAKTI